MRRVIHQAIITKYLPPTDWRSARVKASCDAGHQFTDWDNSLDPVENHARAAKALAEILGWEGDMHQGTSPAGEGVFVFANSQPIQVKGVWVNASTK